MYKTAFLLLMALSVFIMLKATFTVDPVVSAIRGLESTLYFLAALAFYVIDDKRGNKP